MGVGVGTGVGAGGGAGVGEGLAPPPPQPASDKAAMPSKKGKVRPERCRFALRRNFSAIAVSPDLLLTPACVTSFLQAGQADLNPDPCHDHNKIASANLEP